MDRRKSMMAASAAIAAVWHLHGCIAKLSHKNRGAGKETLYHNYSVNDVYARPGLSVRKDEKLGGTPVKVLIGGAGSYIGTNVGQYLRNHGGYDVHTLDMVNLVPEPSMFEGFQTVFYVAGIAHRRETKENAHIYFEVNRDLAVEAAKAAKKAQVRHFIILSSMAVYGMETGYITKDTKTDPKSCYGKSKLAADEEIWKLRSKDFRVAVLRPPMVYGKGCKGNYRLLCRIAKSVPVFPLVDNERSMIYIGNLCAFVMNVVENQREGIFFPQNAEYVCTGEMVRQIAAFHGKKVRFVPGGWIKALPVKALRKAFGSLAYEKTDSVERYGFAESVIKTEGWIFD